MRPLTCNTFAKRLGFKNGKAYGFKGLLSQLERKGAVEIQQGGFNGDSMHHPKLVIVKDLDYIRRFLNPNLLPEKKLPKWHRRPRCHHKDFQSITILHELEWNDIRVRKLLLKCGHCDFCLVGIEVNGTMKRTQPYSILA